MFLKQPVKHWRLCDSDAAYSGRETASKLQDAFAPAAKPIPPAPFPLLRIRKGKKIVCCIVVQLKAPKNNAFFLFPAPGAAFGVGQNPYFKFMHSI